MSTTLRFRRIRYLAVGGVAIAALAIVPAIAAHAATAIDLGDATGFGVLAGSTVTNTGDSTIQGDLGVTPGSAITGFPPGLVSGTTYSFNDQPALDAQAALTTAYNVAAGLSPSGPDVGELAGLSLVPGVYNADTALSLTGTLTLVGSANSVWVFQAGTTLITGAGSQIILTGGASACNVFWQVGTSATLAANSSFVGTVMANVSITAVTGAAIEGRLLARTGAVTLDTNDITVPSGCTTPASPSITSDEPDDATVGVPYSHTITSEGSPTPAYDVTEGELPTGLTMVDGTIAGTPSEEGAFAFRILVDNGLEPDVVADYVINVGPAPALLAETGIVAHQALPFGLLLVAGGIAIITRRRRLAF
jgi:hypothetical protein